MKTTVKVPGRVRFEVLYFAGMMETELRENDYKGGWSECSLLWLQAKLSEEAGELGRLLVKLHHPTGQVSTVTDANRKLVDQAISECADVGNVAMMIMDVLSERLKG